MNAQQIQEDMRSKLRAAGLTPTARGARSARHTQKQMRQEAHDAIDRLDPRDLFSVWLIAGELTREDTPTLAPRRQA